MYDLLKKHKRHLLAIATALLMVAFLLPNFRGQGGGNPEYGKAHGKKLYLSDIRESQMKYNQLRTRLFVQRPGPMGQPQVTPVVAGELGAYAAEQMERHPEMFALLVREAREQGVFVSDQMLQQAHEQLIAPDLDLRRPDVAVQVNLAMRDLLMVRELYQRMLSAVRVSQPLTDYQVATLLQGVKLSAVDFKAAEFAKVVSAPTQDQLQQQYAKYKDTVPTPPNSPSPQDNPYGFGYRYPDRAQVQYIQVPTEAVRRVVEATRSAERWSIDAEKYYRRNPRLYSSTTRPAGTTQPVVTTRPFKEVEQDAIDAVVRPEAEKLSAAVVSKINAILSADWSDFHAAGGPAKNSSLGVPFDTYEYLQKLAAVIEKEFKVQITIGASGDLLGEYELQKLGAIEQAASASGVPFRVYALMTEANRKKLQTTYPGIPQALVEWQPSQALRDFQDNVFFFRRTKFDPAHSPQNLAEVGGKVEADVRLVMEVAKARESAEAFAKAARADGMATTAKAQKRVLSETGPVSKLRGVAMGLHLTDMGNRQFIESAIVELLGMRAKGERTPIAAVEVPRDGRVVVARLDDVMPIWPEGEYAAAVGEADQMTYGQLGAPLYREWFAFGNITKRMQYTSATTRPVDEDQTPSEVPDMDF